MKGFSRKDRLCGITATLTGHPNVLYSLTYFSERFGAAKSSLSEDITIIKEAMSNLKIGEIEVVIGAGGGVRFVPTIEEGKQSEIVGRMIKKLTDPSRILPGGFIYTADIFLSPEYVEDIARLLWGYFKDTEPDYVVTVEAKGIPVSMAVAKLFGKPLVVARKGTKMTEGSVVTINYLSGSSRRVQTMSLSKRAVVEGKRALIVDDFLAGGGTVRAVCDLMREFNITVVGVGAAISTKYPAKKRVSEFKSIIELEEINEELGIIKASEKNNGVKPA